MPTFVALTWLPKLARQPGCRARRLASLAGLAQRELSPAHAQLIGGPDKLLRQQPDGHTKLERAESSRALGEGATAPERRPQARIAELMRAPQL